MSELIEVTEKAANELLAAGLALEAISTVLSRDSKFSWLQARERLALLDAVRLLGGIATSHAIDLGEAAAAEVQP